MKLKSIICLIGVAWGVALSGLAKEKGVPAEDLFVQGQIPKIQIVLSQAAQDQLRQHPRTYVLGTVHEGNRVYTNVSIRLKGALGSFRPIDDRPAFTVNFGRA